MSRLIDSTPRADGFRMPGEFEPHKQIWMLWPQRTDNWRLGAKPAQHSWVDVATAISRFEPVTVGVNGDQYENAVSVLPASVRVIELSSNDAWMRDCGPTFVVNDKGDVRLVDWDFNAWGGLYDGLYFPWEKDKLVPQKIAQLEGVDRYKAHIVMEGGSIHVDGEGTVITTEECLLSPGRNPDMTREQIEQHLRDYLGVEKVVWLARGIDPEETNGHVDDVACFVRPGVVLAAVTEDEDDWRYELLQDNLRVLRAATDAKGRQLEVHTVPMPAIMEVTEEEAWGVDSAEGSIPRRPGDKTAASYLNFLIVNGGVILPTFDDTNDAVAREIIAGAFPDREVVTVLGREIVLGGGNVHCITQQQPRGLDDARRNASRPARGRPSSSPGRRSAARHQLLAPRLAIGLEQVAAAGEEGLGRLVLDQDLQLRLHRAEPAEALFELVHERVGDALASALRRRREVVDVSAATVPAAHDGADDPAATVARDQEEPGVARELEQRRLRSVGGAHPQVAALPQHVDHGVVVHGEVGDGDVVVGGGHLSPLDCADSIATGIGLDPPNGR